MSWVSFAFGLPFILGGIGRWILGTNILDGLFPVLIGLNFILLDIILPLVLEVKFK